MGYFICQIKHLIRFKCHLPQGSGMAIFNANGECFSLYVHTGIMKVFFGCFN